MKARLEGAKDMRYASAGTREDPPDVCMWQRGKTNNAAFFLHRQTIPLCASFTLPFVSIPPSISKTWLKCSSSKHLCWTQKKKKNWQRDGRRKWGGKSQTQLLQRWGFYFSSFTDMWKTHRHSTACTAASHSPPRYPRTSPQQCRTQWPSLNNTSLTFLFQSVVKIPTAPFSPITLFVVYRGAACGTEKEACEAR